MFPIKIIAHCPVCNKNIKMQKSSFTTVMYNDESYALLHCNECDTAFIGKTAEITDINERVHNKKDIDIVNKLTSYFEKQNYDKSTQEETIENELFDYAETLIENMSIHTEYSIKHVIQLIIANSMHNPMHTHLKSHIYDNVKDKITYVSSIMY